MHTKLRYSNFLGKKNYLPQEPPIETITLSYLNQLSYRKPVSTELITILRLNGNKSLLSFWELNSHSKQREHFELVQWIL
ncbi:unnamed protein product [Caenorhabditis auriculariae]|uniref:Uncharacterized protein n=1 Tax=Caenorhabditis auriculariae TaxID=2777116 RepID=A0A8S1H1J4_9PELO|nr:unnamed protein product [Caenorhabditis auriculariae]